MLKRLRSVALFVAFTLFGVWISLALSSCTLGPTRDEMCGDVPVIAHINQWIPERCKANLGCFQRENNAAGTKHIWYPEGNEWIRRHECAHANGMEHSDAAKNCYRITWPYGPYRFGDMLCVDGTGNETRL